MKRWLAVAATRGYLLGAAAFALYAALAPTTIVGGDNPEFCALSVLGGRAHPSGYPLYVLWLRATSWLPGATPAHTAALATCVLAALAVVALHAACRAWGARPVAASLAVAIYAGSPLVLIDHTVAEVFALNALAVAGVLWLAADGGPARGIRRAALLGLVAGLGLSDQLTCALVAPIGLYGVYRGAREAGTDGGQRAALAVAAAIGALAIGLLPYAYLAIAPDSPISWGHVGSFDDLLAIALRREYGSTSLASGGGGRDVPASTYLALLARALGRAWWYAPTALGVATLGWRSIRTPTARASTDAATAPRAAWIALTCAFVLAGPVFVSRFNIDPDGLGLHTVQRFFLLPSELLAIPIAVALSRLVGERAAMTAPAPTAAISIVGLLAFAAPSLAAARAEHSPAVENELVGTLRAVPANAAIITDGDDFAFGFVYVQQVLAVRPDVLAITWPMMSHDWYRARWAARGVTLDGVGGDPHDRASVRLATSLLAAGHAVYVDDLEPNILAELPSYPFAGLFHVLPRGATPPALPAVVTENQQTFAAFDLDYSRPGPDDGYPTLVHVRYANTWVRLAQQYHRLGQQDAADMLMQAASAVGPEP